MAGGSKIWTVRGIPAELQSAVSAAAKSARQTLGEWTATALNRALAGEAPAGAPAADGGRLDEVETRLAQLERRFDGIDNRAEGTQFRVDGLEHRTEGLESRIATLARRLDGSDTRGPRGTATPPPAARTTLPDDDDAPQGPFTRGIGSRKRLTTAGEEELQRLLAAGVDDAAIAARLGIHKRIVWARRLTDSGD